MKKAMRWFVALAVFIGLIGLIYSVFLHRLTRAFASLRSFSWQTLLVWLIAAALLPVALLFYLRPALLGYWEIILFVPCLVMYVLYRIIWSKLRGYTGDCCGALFLLIELSLYLTMSVLCK